MRDGRILHVNPAGCALLGRSREDLVGRGFSDLAPQRRVEDRESPRFVQRLQRPDGREVSIDYTLDELVLGDAPVVVVTGHDVTQLQRTADALQKSEQLFRGLYTQTPMMMWAVDYEGRFKEVSEALLARLGYERGETIGTDSRAWLTEDSLVRLLEMNARNLEARNWVEEETAGE